MPYKDDKEIQAEEADTAEAPTTHPDGDQPIQWKVVTKTAGITPATIIVGRLVADGIPARAWQEGAGQAYGLTVGLLGNGYVMVPETYLEQAKAVLAEEFDEEE
jgi:hypothetical protein